jgi:uridine kinase
VSRAVQRDAGGIGDTAAIRARYEQRYIPGQRLYIEHCRPKEVADIIVENGVIEKPHVQFKSPEASRITMR